jgi:hypothetical protein
MYRSYKTIPLVCSGHRLFHVDVHIEALGSFFNEEWKILKSRSSVCPKEGDDFSVTCAHIRKGFLGVLLLNYEAHLKIDLPSCKMSP